MESWVRPENKAVYMTATLGDDMDTAKFLDAAMTIVDYMLDNKELLVHCDFGKHRSGCLVCFVGAVVQCDCVTNLMEDYIKGQTFEGLGIVDLQHLWEDSCLWRLLDSLLQESDTSRMIEDIKDILHRSQLRSLRLQAFRPPASSQSATHEQGGAQQRSGQFQSMRHSQPSGTQSPRREQHGVQQPSGKPKSKRLVRQSRVQSRSRSAKHKQREIRRARRQSSESRSARNQSSESHTTRLQERQTCAKGSVKEELPEKNINPLPKAP